MQTAAAQTQTPGQEQHVDLNASADAGPDQSAPIVLQGSVTGTHGAQPSGGPDKLFNDPPPEEGGWKGLARLLEAISPNIDTQLPLTSAQITDRISNMLDQGQNQEALEIIEKRQAQLNEQGTIGTDVQLLFLHARALAATGRDAESIAAYQKMTTLYPELPEPWNNLAAQYVKQGKLDMARDALVMALTANPKYAAAQENLGQVQLMLAQRSFQEAARLGGSPAPLPAIPAKATGPSQ